jgi:predicted metal-dependent hydrolase
MNVRTPEFFRNVKLSDCWFDSNPFSTNLVIAYDILFPEGEKFFIRSVKKYSRKISEPELKENVRIFIGQEAVHMNETRKFMEVLPQRVQWRQKLFTRFYEFTFRILEKLLSFVPKLNLSITSALEQYTAIFSEAVFDDKLFANVPGPVTAFHRWHAAEEIEHKDVAYDVFMASGGSYVNRMAGFFLASVLMFGYAFSGFVFLCLTDSQLYKRPVWAAHNLGRFLAQWADVTVRQVRPVMSYFRPGYHPSDIEHPALGEFYLETAEFQQYMPNAPGQQPATTSNPIPVQTWKKEKQNNVLGKAG